MSRLSLLTLAAACGLAAWGGVDAQEAHLAPDKFVDDCSACHRGHGVSGTAMLSRAGDAVCLGCHGPQAAASGQRLALGMTPGARPADIEAEIRKPVIHRGALCSDCHSVHGVQVRPQVVNDRLTLGLRKPSPRHGFTDESDLCMSCHGGTRSRVEDPLDIGVLFDPSDTSYHPVLSIASSAGVPSLLPPLTDTSLINCTDCHRNDDPTAPKGPHGSRVPGLLGAEYALQDGQTESPATYALCYGCHDRDVVLSESGAFPLHQEHVVEDRTPCSYCHNPHGATVGRALIFFNEPTSLTNVNPSGSGRLEFVSMAPGEGACFLTCHGRDHDPLGYGAGFSEDGSPLFQGSAFQLAPFAAGRGSADRGLARAPASLGEEGAPVERAVPEKDPPK